MTYSNFYYDEKFEISNSDIAKMLRKYNLTKGFSVRSRRFYVAAIQIIRGQRKKIACSLEDKKLLDCIIEDLKEDKFSGFSNLKLDIDVSDFHKEVLIEETLYKEIKTYETVDEEYIRKEEPMSERVESTYIRSVHTRPGISKNDVKKHNNIHERIKLYHRLESDEFKHVLPGHPLWDKKFNLEEVVYKGGFMPLWLKEEKYKHRMTYEPVQVHKEPAFKVEFKPPVEVFTVGMRKKTIEHIIREPYKEKKITYKRERDSEIWNTVSGRKQMEIIHGVFLFENEPGFVPLKNFIRYNDHEKENKRIKEDNQKIKGKVIKVKNLEEWKKRFKRGKNQRLKHFENFVWKHKDKIAMEKIEYDKYMRENLEPLKKKEEVKLEDRYEKVHQAFKSFLKLRDYRRTKDPKFCDYNMPKVPNNVLRNFDTIWKHMRYKEEVAVLQNGKRLYKRPWVRKNPISRPKFSNTSWLSKISLDIERYSDSD